jgi:hypothetical protein
MSSQDNGILFTRVLSENETSSVFALGPIIAQGLRDIGMGDHIVDHMIKRSYYPPEAVSTDGSTIIYRSGSEADRNIEQARSKLNKSLSPYQLEILLTGCELSIRRNGRYD